MSAHNIFHNLTIYLVQSIENRTGEMFRTQFRISKTKLAPSSKLT